MRRRGTLFGIEMPTSRILIGSFAVAAALSTACAEEKREPTQNSNAGQAGHSGGSPGGTAGSLGGATSVAGLAGSEAHTGGSVAIPHGGGEAGAGDASGGAGASPQVGAAGDAGVAGAAAPGGHSGNSATGGAAGGAGGGLRPNPAGCMGANSRPNEDPDNVCHGLAGSYELTPGNWDQPCDQVDSDIGVYDPYTGGDPWVWLPACPMLILEASGEVCAARVAEPWREPVPAQVSFEPDRVRLVVDGDGAVGGGYFDTWWLHTWHWRAFELAIDASGALACTAMGTYDDYSSDDYYGSRDLGLTAAMVVREPTTDLFIVHPRQRASALPWDQPLVLQAARPLPNIGDILKPSPVVDQWTVTGERTAESRLLGTWDELRGQEYFPRIARSARENSGQSFLRRRVPLSVYDVGPAVRALDFNQLPVAHWGRVWVDDGFPCEGHPCVGVRSWWGRTPNGSGVAWQLDTTGATEVRISFYFDAEYPPRDDHVHVFDPSGNEPRPLSYEIDEAARTFTFRYDPAGAERVGIEVGDWDGVNAYEPVFLRSSEAR